MTSKETIFADGDLVIEKLAPESDDLQPCTFKRLKEDIKKDEEGEEHVCWGCKQSFGNPKADPLTLSLFQILDENLLEVPDEQIFAEIMLAQQELFVNKNPEAHWLWTVQSIRNHVENHMIYPKYVNARDFRNFNAMEKGMSDTLFRKDEMTGQLEVDPKKIDALLRLNKSKQEAMKAVYQRDL